MIDGVRVKQLKMIPDERGRLMEILRQAGYENTPVLPISSEETKRPAPHPRNSQLENARLKREKMELLPPWQEAVGRYLKQLAAGNR